MKDYMNIILDNKKVIRRKIKNPSGMVDLTYKVNNEKVTYPYRYRREYTIERPGFFPTREVFYHHKNPEPLDPTNFQEISVDVDEMNSYIDSKLSKALFDSTKPKMSDNTKVFIVLALVAGLVLIVVLG